MSINGHAKEAAGYVKEEINEHSKTADGQRKAAEGRELRNEGRIEDGKAPKTAQPGTGRSVGTHRPDLSAPAIIFPNIRSGIPGSLAPRCGSIRIATCSSSCSPTVYTPLARRTR